MTAAPRLALLALIASAGAFGCNNGEPDPVTSATGAGGATGSGGNSGNTGSGGDTGSGGSPGSGGSASTPTKFGAVTVLQQPNAGGWLGVFSATFYEAEGTPADCTSTDVGACIVHDCTYETPTGNTPIIQRSAGTVIVAGTTTPEELMPNADKTYTPAVVMTQFWNEGAAIEFDATGDEVPAFSGSVVGVAEIALVSPSFAGGMVDVDRSTDLVVTWDGGNAGNAGVILTRVEEMGTMSHSVAVVCSYPPADKTGTVPTAALQMIPAGPGGSMSFYNRDDDIQDIGEWRLTLSSLSSNVAATANYQ